MKTFRKDLNTRLKGKAFKKIYEEERASVEYEKQLIEYGLLLKKYREAKRMTQQELAKKANVTQQQLSNIESGANATIQTYIRICDVLKVAINFDSQKRKKAVA